MHKLLNFVFVRPNSFAYFTENPPDSGINSESYFKERNRQYMQKELPIRLAFSLSKNSEIVHKEAKKCV
jgi:hypothetical protein